MLLTILWAASLSVDYGLPKEWDDVADVADGGMDRSLDSHCGNLGRELCRLQMGREVVRLREAWTSEYTTVGDRMMMLTALDESTSAKGTNWIDAATVYFSRRLVATWQDGRAVKPEPVPPSYGARTTTTTRCWSYWGRRGRAIYSGCTTTSY